MRALVTGGAGFIGTNLVNRLVKDNHEVIVFDNLSTGKQKNINKESKLFMVDISLQELFEIQTMEDIMSGVDVIFHMAALPRIAPSFKNPKEVFNVNVTGTQNILECARKYDIPVIYAGSSSFHGGTYKNPYTFTKWQGEELCRMYNEIFGLKTTICRFYNVYGDYMQDEGAYRTVLSIFKEQQKSGKPLTITGDGEQRRDFTHVDDVVDGLVKCMEHTSDLCSTYELGKGKNYSINEIVDMIGGERTYIDAIQGEVRETLRTNDNALNVLKWKPEINLEEWIKNEIQK